ncbi:MAG: hypothetical protein IJ087_03740 [Eggerthellaceae bacterium]|nr:hypothetical protein [Eggerthellaceae bacterium]
MADAKAVAFKNLCASDGEEVAFTAQWEAANYNIAFNLNGGALASQEIANLTPIADGLVYNDTVDGKTFTIAAPTASNALSRGNYKFVGWFVEGMEERTGEDYNTITVHHSDEGTDDSVTSTHGSKAVIDARPAADGDVVTVEFGDMRASAGRVDVTALWIRFDAPSGDMNYTGFAPTATVDMVPAALGKATVRYYRNGSTSGTKTAQKNAGSYKVAYSFTDNVTGSENPVTFSDESSYTIKKVPVTIDLQLMSNEREFTASTIIYGEPSPVGRVTVTGLVGEDRIPANPTASSSPVRYSLVHGSTDIGNTTEYQWSVYLAYAPTNYYVPRTATSGEDDAYIAYEPIETLGYTELAKSIDPKDETSESVITKSPFTANSMLYDTVRKYLLTNNDYAVRYYEMETPAVAGSDVYSYNGKYYSVKGLYGNGGQWPEEPGVYMASLSAYGKYYGTRNVMFGVTDLNIETATTIEVSTSSAVFDGQDKMPTVTVKAANDGIHETGTVLSPSEDYSVEVYEGETTTGTPVTGGLIDPGKYTIAVKGSGAYNGAKTYEFEILPNSLADSNTNLSVTHDTTVSLKGTNNKPSANPAVSIALLDANGGTLYNLVSGKDYTVEYLVNGSTCTNLTKLTKVASGTVATATIKGVDKGDATTFEGSRTFEFKLVKPVSLSTASVVVTFDTLVDNATGEAVWKGVPVEPTVSVTCNGTPLTLDTDYTVSYRSNESVGSDAMVVVKGVGEYTGSYYKSFTIVEQDASLHGTDLVHGTDIVVDEPVAQPTTDEPENTQPAPTTEPEQAQSTPSESETATTSETQPVASTTESSQPAASTPASSGSGGSAPASSGSGGGGTAPSAPAAAAPATPAPTEPVIEGVIESVEGVGEALAEVAGQDKAGEEELSGEGKASQDEKAGEGGEVKEGDGSAETAATTGETASKAQASSTSTLKTQVLKVTAKVKTLKAKTLKKTKQTFKRIVVKGAKGTLTYKKVGGSKALSVNKATGKVTVKKGTKAGVYKMTVKVTAAATKTYAKATKEVEVTVKVK